MRKFVQNQRWLFLILSLVGILSYLQPHPSKRLGIVGLGVAIDTMLVSSLWWTNRRSHAIITHLLGLVLFLIVKVVYITNNPVWPAMNHTNGGLNLEAVFATVLCALIVLFRCSFILIFNFFFLFKALISLRNFNGAMSVLSGLCSSCITRLKGTFETIPAKVKKVLEESEIKMSSVSSFKNYRSMLRSHPNAPTIPFL